MTFIIVLMNIQKLRIFLLYKRKEYIKHPIIYFCHKEIKTINLNSHIINNKTTHDVCMPNLYNE